MKKKLKKFLGIIVVLAIIGIVVWQIPTIADWGDYESYDSSSSYDDWGSSSSYDYDDWGSSSSYDYDDYDYDYDYDDWGSSWSSWDDGYHSSSFYYFGSGSRGSKLSLIIAWVFVIFIAFYLFKNRHNTNSFLRGNRPSIDAEMQRRRNREVLFGVSDAPIENQIQEIDPMFNKAEFLSWASDMFVKLQYAWSDRNLEEIRHFVTPDLYEQTNNQVQRYIQNKQINKLERISVNLYRLYSFAEEGDREILRVVLESKMIDYIIDETTQKVVRGNQAINVVNPYILTFVRKAGVKTPEGGVKPVTMNCPNCGGATTILSSGKCPYCGSIITTRDNHWTLSEMKRYNPNA